MYPEEPTLRHGSQFLRMIGTVIPVCKPSALNDFVVGQKAGKQDSYFDRCKSDRMAGSRRAISCKRLTSGFAPP
jgi:hypothetical protein